MLSASSSADSRALGPTSHDDDVLSAVDRRGYPEEKKKKKQPWKEMGLKITNDGGLIVGRGSGVLSSAWEVVLVACSRIHDQGTGGLGGH